MQLRNCINECMLWFLECWSYFIIGDLILLFMVFVELLGLVDAFFYCLWNYFSCLCLAVGHWSEIEMCVKSAFATVCVRSTTVGCFLLFWWVRLSWDALQRVTWSKKPNNKLKVIISSLSETKSESESFMIPFYGNPLNSARGCIQMAITAAVVTENVCMSRHWKAKLVAYIIHTQSLSCFMHLLPLKPDRSPVCPESFQHLVMTLKPRSYQTVHRNRPYE
jgi:hypothetical protein